MPPHIAFAYPAFTSPRLPTTPPLTTPLPRRRLAAPSRRRRRRHQVPCSKLVRVSVPISIEAPPAHCHALFSDLSQMPNWSSTLESVARDPADPVFSDWTFAWSGIRLSWRARDADPLPGPVTPAPPIRWASVSGLMHLGCVEFESQGDCDTRLVMTVDYDIASLLAAVMESSLVSGFVESAIQADLRRFRNYALRALRKERIRSRQAS